jgi:acyl-CoA thioesterase FadM
VGKKKNCVNCVNLTTNILACVCSRKGTPLALAELNLQFKGPLRSRDRYRVSVWVEKLTAARLVLGQQVELIGNATSGSKPVLSAQAVVVWLDAQYRPIRLPADVRPKLQELHDAYHQAKADAVSSTSR